VHVGDQLVDRLISYGVRHIFGCPGGQTLPMYNGIAKRADEISHVLMRDERSGAFAADAYARATGRVGVCDATVGPGASNLVSGLVEALSASIPILAIVSDIARHWEHRRHMGSASQAIEQRRFLEGCVKYYGRVDVNENLPEMLHACLRIATAGRPGPVILEIPDDIFAGPAGSKPDFAATPEWATYPRLRAGADPRAIAAAVDLLARSSKPVVVAGGGALIADAGLAIVDLIETLGCPLTTSVSAKGLVPETHPWAASVAGRFGVPMANTLLEQSDCVIFIGCKTGQTTTMGWSSPPLTTEVIQIDSDAEEIGRSYHRTVGVVADALVGTIALTDAIRQRGVRSHWDVAEVQRLQRDWWDGPVEYRDAVADGWAQPQDVVRSMRTLMPESATLVTDASLASGWGASRWPAVAKAGRHFFAPRGLAGLGWGLPAAIGVAMARRDSAERVVCLAGDGGWAYSLGEVETAARLELPLVSVVLNNSTLGWIKHTAANRKYEMVSEDFREVNFAESAAGLGAEARRVSSIEQFAEAFGAAIADESGRPWVIEVVSSKVETPVLQLRVPTTTGY
jgi:acetolactate synthase-1/2/3 large subunit